MRSCGPCTACCTAQGVKEGLETPKPPGVPCVHLSACGGCAIYKSRPKECRNYSCLWLLGIGPIEERPDLLGVLYEHQPHPEAPQGLIIVRVLREGQERSTRVRWNMRELVKRGFWVGVAQKPPPEGAGWVQEASFYTKLTDFD